MSGFIVPMYGPSPLRLSQSGPHAVNMMKMDPSSHEESFDDVLLPNVLSIKGSFLIQVSPDWKLI